MKALAAMALLLAAGGARADTCSASMPNIDFGAVSPIGASDVFASSTGSVSCTWNPVLGSVLLPRVKACVNIGLGSNSLQSNPRTLGSGSARMEYNLYRDATYAPAAIAGGPTTPGTPTPISITMSAPSLVLGGTLSAPFTLRGKIAAGPSLRAVQTIGNANTLYNSSFSAAATISYTFYGLLGPEPVCSPSPNGSFSFQVQATAVNDCTISAAALDFGSGSLPGSVVRSTAGVSVRCVKNNAYQIALNGGSVAANPAARKMRRASGSETLSYQLSGSLDGPVWGDGSGGTTLHADTGTGEVQLVPVYGRVPAQSAPVPGDYADTVTATVYF